MAKEVYFVEFKNNKQYKLYYDNNNYDSIIVLLKG